MDRKVSPKRMQRDIKKQLSTRGIGTKPQQTLSLQHAESKTVRKEKAASKKKKKRNASLKYRSKNARKNTEVESV